MDCQSSTMPQGIPGEAGEGQAWSIRRPGKDSRQTHYRIYMKSIYENIAGRVTLSWVCTAFRECSGESCSFSPRYSHTRFSPGRGASIPSSESPCFEIGLFRIAALNRIHSERIGSLTSSVLGPSFLWRSRKRTQAFQRKIGSSLPGGRRRSASSNNPSALTIQS
jgi:hypothetical protein